MKNNKKALIMLSILMLGIGISFGFFIIQNIFNGEGSEINATTEVAIEGSTVTVEGNLDLGDGETVAGMLPGHKIAAKIKVTATGPNQYLMYNLIWAGEKNEDGTRANAENKLNTKLNYTVYRVLEETISPDVKCDKVQKYKDGYITLNEECTITNEAELGEAIASGEIPIGESTLTLKADEKIISSSDGTSVYYYVVIEYPNAEHDQNIDAEISGSALIGIVTVEASMSEGSMPTDPLSVILANANEIIESGVDYSTVATETTDGIIYKKVITSDDTVAMNATTPKFTLLANEAETSSGTTYYFRGAATDNYMKFAGFYWRIIRVNENGGLRLIYSGKVSDVDAAGKETVLANGYNDSETKLTQIGESKFGEYSPDGETIDMSYIYESLNYWYESNLLVNYHNYMDIDSGFCVDSEYDINDDIGICENFIDQFGESSSTQNISYSDCLALKAENFVTDTRYYAPYYRIVNNSSPTFDCKNENGNLYTLNTSSYGNQLLEYPIGLITADEVVYAGGTEANANELYYLYNGYSYWTTTPYSWHNTPVAIFTLSNKLFQTRMDYAANEHAIRPVINLRADISIKGQGTIDSPYEIME